MTKRRYLKGLEKELLCSKRFHEQGIPLLLSSQLLRSWGLGQVDLARLLRRKGEWLIELNEVKDGGILSQQQRKRLKKTSIFVGLLFNCPVVLSYNMNNFCQLM